MAEFLHGLRIADSLVEILDMALSLHQALPDDGYASQRALKRLAGYQADARAFGTVRCLMHMRSRLGRTSRFAIKVVPGHMVRDIGLPPFLSPERNTARQTLDLNEKIGLVGWRTWRSLHMVIRRVTMQYHRRHL